MTKVKDILKKIKPYAPSEKLVVRDSLSLSLDEELSDDIEDEVFIRDGRTCKTYEEDRNAKRPLMAHQRRKNSKSSGGSTSPILKKYRRRRCWNCCEPFCYGLAAIIVLIGLIVLAALLLTAFPQPLQKIKVWFHKESPFSTTVIRDKFNSLLYSSFTDGNNREVVPCTEITVQKIWSRPISRVNSETPVRKLDINGDNIEDVIVGYGIDEMIDNQKDFIPRCTSIKTGLTDMCGGGLLALNGQDGDILWQRWTTFTIFSLQCSVDLNRDGQKDCVAAGRGGLIISVDGKTGNILWELKDYSDLGNFARTSIDLYTINIARDLDSDGVYDIIAVHVEEGDRIHGGHIKIISGANGNIIRSIPTPYREEVFVPMQMLVQPDGTEILLVVTGGQNSAGGIYAIKLNSLMKYTSDKDFEAIMKISTSGFMVPAVLTDINNDHVEDIIVSSFNSTIYAFDGHNHTLIWSYTISDSESVSSIVPGMFDHDNVTDFMIKYNTGPGFPIYYYSQTTILNGTNGTPFLDSTIKDSGGPNSLLAGLSFSQTFGGDFFLHWQLYCRDQNLTKDEYQFVPDSDVVQQSRADSCALRYNKTTVLKLHALSRHVEPPGSVIFSSDDLSINLNLTDLQSNNDNYVAPMKHPKMKLKASPKNEENVEENNDQSNIDMKKKVITDNNEIQKSKIRAKDREQMLNSNYVLPESNNFDDDVNNKEKLNMNEIYKKYRMNVNGGEDLTNQPAEIDKPYIYLPYDQNDRKNSVLNQQQSPDDYEYINEEENRRYRRPKYHQGNPYSGGRDVRSQLGVFDDIEIPDSKIEEIIYNETLKSSPSVKKVLKEDKNAPKLTVKKGTPETLWDLEIEKENKEDINNIDNDNYDTQIKRGIQNASVVNILPTIASSGVLLNPINSSESRIDYIFVLNIRESETYPPLLLEQDITCVQEKLKAYRGYNNDDLLVMEKKFLKLCLKNRLPDLKPVYQKYETQIVITRLAITCKCGNDLNPKKEVCSKLNGVNKQKWTEYMGNGGEGIYPN